MKNLFLIISALIIFGCSKPSEITPTKPTATPPIISIIGSWNENSQSVFKLYVFYPGIDSAYYIGSTKTGSYSFNQKTLILSTSGWGGSSTNYNVIVADSNHFNATSGSTTLTFVRL